MNNRWRTIRRYYETHISEADASVMGKVLAMGKIDSAKKLKRMRRFMLAMIERLVK